MIFVVIVDSDKVIREMWWCMLDIIDGFGCSGVYFDVYLVIE